MITPRRLCGCDLLFCFNSESERNCNIWISESFSISIKQNIIYRIYMCVCYQFICIWLHKGSNAWIDASLSLTCNHVISHHPYYIHLPSVTPFISFHPMSPSIPCTYLDLSIIVIVCSWNFPSIAPLISFSLPLGHLHTFSMELGTPIFPTPFIVSPHYFFPITPSAFLFFFFFFFI